MIYRCYTNSVLRNIYGGLSESGLSYRSWKPELRKGPWVRIPPPPPKTFQSMLKYTMMGDNTTVSILDFDSSYVSSILTPLAKSMLRK